MEQELRLAILEAITDFYDKSRENLDYDQYKRESLTALAAIDTLPAPPLSGPILTRYVDFVGASKVAETLRRFAKSFNLTYNTGYAPYIHSTYNERKLIWEEDKEMVRSLERKDREWRLRDPDGFEVDLALRNNLLYPFADAITKALHTPVPYQFAEDLRFRGQWIVGSHGTGKTTYLANLIHHDLLEIVAKDQGSVVVIDSQNELVPDLSKLALFAPGGALFGKLIYIEPDPARPLALNIFDTTASRFSSLNATDRETVIRGAMQFTQFFLRSILESDTTPHMNTVLKHLVPAVMSIENATIFTLQELAEEANTKTGKPSGYERLHDKLSIDPEEHRWFREHLHNQEFRTSLGAIRARLDGFTADPMFRRMFRHPKAKLDLFEELQSSKVILINTNKGLLKEATEPFGRFFIAKLLQATEERMLVDRGSRLPVYAYIDEAADYIATEENLAELVNKARKQRVSLNLAAQSEDDIRSPTVLAAVRRMAIQTRLTRPKEAAVALPGKELSLEVPAIDLTRKSTMSKRDWSAMLAAMHERYTTPVQTDFEPNAGPPKDHRTPTSGDTLPAVVNPDEEIRPVKDW